MIPGYLTYLEVERRYSPRTIAAYHDDLRDFCRFYGWESFADFRPNDLDENDIRTWLIYMMDKGDSPRSVRRRMSSVHGLYKFLLKMGLAKRDITRKVVTPKVDKPLPVFFKESEMQHATEDMDEGDDFISVRNRLIIDMLYQTGMRQAEMLGLKDADFDLTNGDVRIFGKRSKERVVPIGPQLVAQIRHYLAARDEVAAAAETFFIHIKSNGDITPLTKAQLYRVVTSRMGEVSTLKKHSPHVLRHTFATTMLNNGADIRTIQALLGHSSLRATQVYTHTTFEQIREAYAAAHPRSHKQ